MSPSLITLYPSELLYAICTQVFASCLPTTIPSLDPLLSDTSASHSSFTPALTWSEPITRRTLANLCLVNHDWYEAAKPWLWRRLEVRFPRTWLSLVAEIAWNYDEETVDLVIDKTIRAAANAAVASTSSECDKVAVVGFDENLFDSFEGPDTTISLNLLSSAPSRDTSPRRLRPKSKSPARWKLLRSIKDAVQDAVDRQSSRGMYVPMPIDPRPGRYVQHLDFNHFRTIGVRRSVEEGINNPFVTGDRLQAVVKEMPNLTSFGATEYMDGALTLPVLNELFLRGAASRALHHPFYMNGFSNDAEEEDQERRRECKDLEAVDFTGCVSAVFVNAFNAFVSAHLLTQSKGEEVEEKKIEPLIFPGLERLGLRGVKSILPRYLKPFLMALPSLTHLDLSGTRVTPDILEALGTRPLRLKSLGLARCTKLTSESIRHFLVDFPVTTELTELNLYGDMTYVSPLTVEHLQDILTQAPCLLGGQLVYLDLSSAPINESLLSLCKPQPKLCSLGLSHIPKLELNVVADFLLNKASNVEVLTLINTSPQLDLANPGAKELSRVSSIALHTHLIRPLCAPQFASSLTTDRKSVV